MNRRNFLGKLLVAGAGFAVLPPATTYSRIWKAQRYVINPDWENANFICEFKYYARPGLEFPRVFFYQRDLSVPADGGILQLP